MAEQPNTSATLRCLVVTPEATVIDCAADFIAVPLFDGELGILPRRAPMVGRLGFGEVRIKSGTSVTRYYVDGGFVQVHKNVVSILTGRSIPHDKLVVAAAQSELDEARAMRVLSPEEAAIREQRMEQSRAQLRMAQRQ